MPLVTIAKRFDFSAAHHLDSLSDGHPCKRSHGHNYRVELEVSGPLDAHGMVIDYGELGPFAEVVGMLDHHDLNERLPGIEPTAENLAGHLFQEAERIWARTEIRVVAVRVSETDKTWAEVRQLVLGAFLAGG